MKRPEGALTVEDILALGGPHCWYVSRSCEVYECRKILNEGSPFWCYTNYWLAWAQAQRFKQWKENYKNDHNAHTNNSFYMNTDDPFFKK